MTKQNTETDSRKRISLVVNKILSNENLSAAIKSFNAANDDEENALEFVRSYHLFIKDVAENDAGKNLIRRSIEIKDLVANINAMLKDRDPDIFRIMVHSSPLHYTFIIKKGGRETENRED